jgi:hypothetical protein
MNLGEAFLILGNQNIFIFGAWMTCFLESRGKSARRCGARNRLLCNRLIFVMNRAI